MESNNRLKLTAHLAKIVSARSLACALGSQESTAPIDTGGAYTYSARITSGGVTMQKKLTIAIAEDVYEGLHKVIGPRKISKFVEELVRPHVVKPLMEGEYARMAKDTKREAEALEWTEATFRDIAHESR